MAAGDEEGLVVVQLFYGFFQGNDGQIVDELDGSGTGYIVVIEEFLVIRAGIHERFLAVRCGQDDVVVVVCQIFRRHGQFIEIEADVALRFVFHFHLGLAGSDDENRSFRGRRNCAGFR